MHITEITATRAAMYGGGQWHLKSLNDVNVIFGRNGCGKSTLLRQIRTTKQDYHYASPERSGDITYDAGIMSQELTDKGRSKARNQNLAQNYRQEAISRVQVMYMTLGDAASRGKAIPDLSVAESLIHELVPDFNFKFLPKKNPPYEFQRIASKELVQSVSHLSSGEAEILSLAIDLLTTALIWEIEEQTERVFLIDEPDVHLHPDLQVVLASFLIQLKNKYRCQMIISSHSTSLLSAISHFGGEMVSVLYMNPFEPTQTFKKLNDEMSALSACLGGHALMGPLFGAPLLLVEGDDDNRLWLQFSRSSKGHRHFSILPCDGAQNLKKYQKSLEQLMTSLRSSPYSESGFALLDGDQSIPTDGSQAHVKYIRLGCREAENLYLSDVVLKRLGLTWDQAKTKIQQHAKNYPGKEQLLMNVASGDKRNHDLKGIMHELTTILDSEKLFWPIRIGKVLAHGKPTGELQEFLGAELVKCIWPASSGD